MTPGAAWRAPGRRRGIRKGAAEAYAHVYYEYPLGDLATTAASQIDALNAWEPIESGSARYKLELGRAERLFGAKRYAQARDGFALVQSAASGDDQELIALRLAEIRLLPARGIRARAMQLAPWTSTARRRAEAQFFYLGAVRELGDDAEYEPPRQRAGERVSRRLVDRGDAEQPRLVLHHQGSGRQRRPGLPAAGAVVSRRAAMRSARVEDRLDRVPHGQVGGLRGHVRARGRRVSAIRLPPDLGLLGRPLPRAAWRRVCRRSALRHHRRRLPELVLRAHGDQSGSRLARSSR